ncbi:vacuolar -sorting-associated 11-like protein isoform A [Chlorella sorokiniana]|uniref:Vacuolar-sorting-associated 11-like protein isoform A n=1 Tax=Chlorella sorokiniana TaxID=3076 RepID=A0A2P6TP23_CHLSO|nr:vacuolar -sorting-associated 11-like protein isoform A [Chlorella sorokiniana]|eukprot:PRW51086.1 vacuolar -sorting-associated 11-like protein isoform A [Chlorella sorokiniana]
MAGQAGFRRLHSFFSAEARAAPPAPSHVACSAVGGGCTWLGCADGTVLCLDAGDLSLRASFQAHHGAVHGLAWCKGKLLTVGSDGDGLRNLHIKGWAVDGLRPGAAPAILASPARLLPSAPSKAASAAGSGAGEGSLTAVALHCEEWPTVAVALGLSNGAVHLLRADVPKSKVTAPVPAAQLRDGGGAAGAAGSTAASTAGGSGSSGITALHFVSVPSAAAGAEAGGSSVAHSGRRGEAAAPAGLHLFAVGSVRLAAFDARTGRRLLDDECGAAPGCSAVSSKGELMLAGSEAVYFYTAEEGRKAAFALRGEKLAVAAARHYLVAVIAEDASPEPGQAVAQVFDLQNKVIAASAPVEPPVRWIAHSGPGCIDVGDATCGVTRLSERPFSEKLEALYKSRSYQLAVAVAETEQVDGATLAGIRRQYGDFLYAKRDYDAAMEQYELTVGHLEPSYVIQRFLDVQRLHALTRYLERLHAQGHASSDHTTLLLNCYTKLKDVAKLDAFIQGDGSMTRDSLHFDIDTAIRVCRQAGYYEHALYVALAACEPQAYLDVLLEDCKRFNEGLEYIKGLPRREAAAALQKYGKALLAAAPVETTAALMVLCLRDPTDPGTWVANMADFTHLYTDRPEDLQYACVTILNMNPDSPSRQVLYHTLLDLYLSPTASSSSSSTGIAAPGGGAGAAPSSGGGSSAEQAGAGPASTASSAVLPAAAAAGGAAEGAAGGAAGGSGSQQEALDLLKRGWASGEAPAYDVDYALVACRLHNFRPGLLFLYENLRLYRELASVLMDARDYDGLIAACQRFGDARTGGDPQLWHDALDYFARQPGDCSQQVRELLGRIEAGGILPPLVVLQVLSQNPRFRLSLVKDYVTRQLQADNRSIRADQEEAERLKAAIEDTRVQAERLQSEPVVFQSSRDSQTNAPLELPSVHFLCGHSFNLRTLGDVGDATAACPLCAAEHRKAQELRRSNRASAADKDSFFKQLRSAPDGFALVAEYFGRGLLNNTSVSQQQGS